MVAGAKLNAEYPTVQVVVSDLGKIDRMDFLVLPKI